MNGQGPRPINEKIGTEEFRKGMASVLLSVHYGRVVLVENRKRELPMAVLVPPSLWHGLGQMKREVNGLSTHPDGRGGYLTRTQVAANLHAEACRLGGETYQLTAGETTAVRGLLAELAGRYPDEPLGELAGEWADRLGTRTAPSL